MRKFLFGFGIISSLLGLFLIFGGAQSFLPAPVVPAIKLSGDPAVEGVSASEQKTLIVEPEAGVNPVLEAINKAVSSINLTIYTISDVQVAGALISAAKRGVNVRVIYNDSFSSDKTRKENQLTVNLLKSGGVFANPGNPRFVFTHQKTLIIDGREALIMTFNLDPSYFKTSRDFGVLTKDPVEVAEIKAVFEADWAGQEITPEALSLVWSPDNSREKILKMINGSSKTLEIYSMVLQDPQVMNALISAARRGIRVRVITTQLFGNGADANANWRRTLNEEGAETKIGKPLFTHAKAALADFATAKETAYIGSVNFSDNSLDANRELGIILSDRAILEELHRVFNSDWEKASEKNAYIKQ